MFFHRQKLEFTTEQIGANENGRGSGTHPAEPPTTTQHLALGQRLGSLALGGDDQGPVAAFHVLGLVELVLPTCCGFGVRLV